MKSFALAISMFVLGAVTTTVVSAGLLACGDSKWWSYAPPRPQMLVSHGREVSSRAWYDYAGHLSGVAFLRGDVPDGASVSFHVNGQLAEVGRFSQGQRAGEWISYLPDGAEVYRAIFEKGVVTSGSWPRDGVQ